MLEIFIELSMEVFCRLFKFNLNWCYAEIDINTPSELKNSISMAYFHEERLIVINPFLLEQYKGENYSEEQLQHIVFALIAHEFRHAWQHTSAEYEKEWNEYKTYVITKGEYLHQKVELDAYAFQEACYWIISDEMRHHLSVPEEAANAVHKLAVELYYQYRSDIKRIIKSLVSEHVDCLVKEIEEVDCLVKEIEEIEEIAKYIKKSSEDNIN